MKRVLSLIRARLDRAGLILSGLCAVHCVLSILIVSVLGLGGELFLAPEIHRFGLAAALCIAAVAIGWGVIQHRRSVPFVVAIMGLIFMSGALVVPHGLQEASLTILGVALVALGHMLNLRSPLPRTR